MGNCDKGLAELAGRSMVERVIEHARPQVGGIVINANRHHEEYCRYGYPVVADSFTGFRGPLAGMAVTLRYCRTRLMMTVPCDSPLLPDDLARRLYCGLKTQSADIAVVDDGERLHPVFCLLPKHLVGSLESFLAGGGRKIDRWFERVNTTYVSFRDKPECFENINTIDDLVRIEQVLTQQ